MITGRRSLLLVTLALVLAACAGDADDGGDDGTAEADGAAAGDGAVDLAVGSTELGEVLVDGDGMTLYLFTDDPEGESVCVDDCASVWPPLVVEGDPTVGDGADPSLVDTIERDDGDRQVTYAGAPLYTWASDQEPGDVSGQGVQDVWYVVAPDGSAITDGGGGEDAGADGTASTRSGGY